MIIIVTAANDLHAMVVCSCVKQLGYENCHIVECDRVAQKEFVSYRVDKEVGTDFVCSSTGVRLDPRQPSVIWLRRIRANQQLDHPIEDVHAYDIVNNDCRGAMAGLLDARLRGVWLSSPAASFRASDKISQLAVASANGLRIPRTLVSQSKREVCRFFNECDGKIIMKTVVGVQEPFLQTIQLNDPDQFDEDSYAASPAIFQELIEGTTHLRLFCYDRQLFGARIESGQLDWRSDLTLPMQAYQDTDLSLRSKIWATLDGLGLAMGVVDIKISEGGEPVWFEVNPQGQFLFLEPLIGVNLARPFAQYLISEATRLG